MATARHILALAGMLLIAGCSAADLVNLITPGDGYTVETDLRYGPGPRGTLDLYVPEAPTPGAPLVVFVYGGAWESGDKSDYLFAGQAFAARGYVTAIPNYRLYPEVRFPDFVHDVAAAIAWLADGENTGLGADRPIALIGHSAGAQIAMLNALDPRYLAAAGVRACDTIQAVVGLAGPYDFLPLSEERYKRVFPEPSRAQSQPINFADGDAPPILLLSGTDDEIVVARNSRRLAERRRAAGVIVEVTFYGDVGHIELVGALAAPLRHRAPVLDDIDAFLGKRSDDTAPFC